MSVRDPLHKIISLDHLLKVVSQLKSEHNKVVTTNGCFDLLHWGHISYLWQARNLGDCLIVLVNTDESVRGLKGKLRPIQNQEARLMQLAGLESVDYVCLFAESTPEQVLSQIKPHVHTKGGDYDPDVLPETAIVRKGGGRVQCLALEPGFSTTDLVKRILQAEAN
jgi:rfaE bifunctional protein nucleotidyltransferase chain/domain